MGLLERICKPCQRATCSRLRARKNKLGQLRGEADAAAAVYGEAPRPPLREATDAEIEQLGMSRKFLEELNDKDGKRTDFRAKMYVNDQTGQRYIAFKGTNMTSKQDWVQNAKQGIGMRSEYYTRAQQIAKRVAGAEGGDSVKFVGHSLGGGLASAAARASGNAATTFNSAGLNPLTVLRGDSWNFGAPIEAVRVRGEILTSVQEAALSPMAEGAYSQRFDLDPPEGFGRELLDKVMDGKIVDAAKARLMRSVDLHGMNNVIRSIDQETRRTQQALDDNGC